MEADDKMIPVAKTIFGGHIIGTRPETTCYWCGTLRDEAELPTCPICDAYKRAAEKEQAARRAACEFATLPIDERVRH